MSITTKEIVPHPQYLEILFAYKSKVGSVFKDVLGLYEIDHFAISYIDHQQELLTLSSTPALEFNLFSSNLWRFDKTYQTSWYSLCTASPWQSLYAPEHYHDLYYLKQAKHHYPTALSLSVKYPNAQVIYSIASHKECQQTHELFTHQREDFYRIGEYCSKALLPLLYHFA